ncbi:hypothetical protein FQN50_004298 [Emmonsiellopsis sp. PD_5]|nr:hypothetical protein FQN50_004298 [Emmonsiellopsis sp. PD_5]
MQHQQDITTKLYAPYELLRMPLPPLLSRPPYQTTTSALHDSHYAQTLVDWNISEGVKNITAECHLCSNPLDASVACVSGNPFRLKCEHYLCGDEQSVCGRFSQNALQPSTAVAFQQSIKTRFGDYKVCQENKEARLKGYIPDFVGVTCPAQDFTALQNLASGNHSHQPTMRIVGEAKTPWKHNLEKTYRAYKIQDDEDIRHALGQIAAYMHQFEMRYGFLTTYDFTIFIMQEYIGPEPVLCITKPIHRSSDSPSVRQCLYYLLHCTQEANSFKFKNHIAIGEWVTGDPSDNGGVKGPRTPISGRSSPMDSFYQMTPAGGMETSDSEPLQLHRWPSLEAYRAVLQFPSQRIHDAHPDLYVTINGKQIEVKIVDDGGSEEGDDDSDSGSTGCRTARRPQDGRASRKSSHKGYLPRPQGMTHKLKWDAGTKSASTPTSELGHGVHRDTSLHQGPGSRLFEPVPSPSPASRTGLMYPQQQQQQRRLGAASIRHEYSGPHPLQTVEPTLPSRDPEDESVERRSRHIAEGELRSKATTEKEGIGAHHSKPPKKDDDKGDRNPPLIQFTLGGNRQRRQPPK